MRVQGANSGQPRGTQANSRREASPTSSCHHFKQFAAGSFPLDCQQDRGNRCIGRLSGLMRAANTDSDTDKLQRLAEII
jgi:hypothetical protein